VGGPSLAVVRTGAANLASVMAALRRAGGQPVLVASPREVESAAALVLPGVGAFDSVMERLRGAGLVEPLAERIRLGRPTMAICLGLQILAESSEEAPGVRGLGVLNTGVHRFSASVRVPQLGWNRVVVGPNCRLLEDGFAYFANSYRMQTAPDWASATADHGGPFVAGVEKGTVLGCQFHPELSGSWGQRLVHRWLAAAEGES
jgi:glutamine amidotransferase